MLVVHETLLKVTGPNGEAVNGGTGKWFLPSGSRPGKWMPKIPNPEPCKRGYHLTTVEHLLDWIARDDAVVWIAEARGIRVDHGDKFAVEQARLVSRIAWSESAARLFAADCAEHVLPIWEKAFPDDRRPREAIEVARRFARGEATLHELAATRAAAQAAAGPAAWAAARAAAWAAAWDAAWAAAWDAAWVAAWDAAWAAAWAAAQAAAQAAAGDAWAAAGAAARAAPRGAAWDAARDAERQWQQDRLVAYLNGWAS